MKAFRNAPAVTQAVSGDAARPALRPVCAITSPGAEPGGTPSALPIFEWVEPTSLLIDDTYQRSLSERSLALIRKILADWDWRRFKPPIAVLTERGLELIDGQHTAIAAAGHPGVPKIPVMIVEAPELAQRAQAFLGHNRDRLNVTATQMHFAALAAGDEDAQTVAQVCERAGVTILRVPPGGGAYKPKQTIAIAAIQALIGRRGAMRAREVLQTLARTHLAPIKGDAIKAVELLMTDPEFADELPKEDVQEAIAAAIIGTQHTAEQDAKAFAATHCVPMWRALAATWFKARPKPRRKAG